MKETCGILIAMAVGLAMGIALAFAMQIDQQIVELPEDSTMAEWNRFEEGRAK